MKVIQEKNTNNCKTKLEQFNTPKIQKWIQQYFGWSSEIITEENLQKAGVDLIAHSEFGEIYIDLKVRSKNDEQQYKTQMVEFLQSKTRCGKVVGRQRGWMLNGNKTDSVWWIILDDGKDFDNGATIFVTNKKQILRYITKEFGIQNTNQLYELYDDLHGHLNNQNNPNEFWLKTDEALLYAIDLEQHCKRLYAEPKIKNNKFWF